MCTEMKSEKAEITFKYALGVQIKNYIRQKSCLSILVWVKCI